ncbi:MAG: PIN domain-containing protein [Desulfobulbaceae bacterium]|nr:PIN domain-containing protein [Desulfobulbaceae bacterium]
MSGKCFVDTNVLVYFRDASEQEKQPQAARWLRYLWKKESGRVSFQVLNEYYVVVTQRLQPGLSYGEARADIRNLLAWRPVTVGKKIIEQGWQIQDRFGFSWWDSLIIAAAIHAECHYLISEDMQHEQVIEGTTIINPFQVSPNQIFES